MEILEDEIYAQIGRMYMVNLMLTKENDRLRAALADDEEDDAEEA